jgi:hypothetical protein
MEGLEMTKQQRAGHREKNGGIKEKKGEDMDRANGAVGKPGLAGVEAREMSRKIRRDGGGIGRIGVGGLTNQGMEGWATLFRFGLSPCSGVWGEVFLRPSCSATQSVLRR